MSGRLIYAMGPSGAGKDSLLAWLKAQGASLVPVHLARRTITRPPSVGGEHHEAVDARAFARLRERKAFALDWDANGLHYGVRHAELAPLRTRSWVMVNGSRAYLPQALRSFPGLTVLYITASTENLRRRLLARGREGPDMVEARVRRASAFRLPTQIPAIEVRNDGSLDEAGAQLLQALQRLPGWPQAPTPSAKP